MRFSLVPACVGVLVAASSAVAQIANFDVFTNPSGPGQAFTAGSSVNITWTPSTPAGPIDLILLEGTSNLTLQIGPTIASGVQSTQGFFLWSIPGNITAFPAFGLKLQLQSDPTIFQYSFPFVITGTGPLTTTIRISQISTMSSTSTAFNSTTTAFVNATSMANMTFSSATLTATSAGRTTPTGTSGPAVTTSKAAASSNAIVGSTGLLGALFVALSMLF